MTKAYSYEATVSGPYTFPVDMLQYDECFPSSEADAGEIEDTTLGASRVNRVHVTRVSLRRRGEPFTARRWESFGWKVEGVREDSFSS